MTISEIGWGVAICLIMIVCAVGLLWTAKRDE